MINKTFDGRTLILVFEDGLTQSGDVKFVKKSINYISEAVQLSDLHTIGTQLATLYNLVFSKVCIDEDFVLTA